MVVLLRFCFATKCHGVVAAKDHDDNDDDYHYAAAAAPAMATNHGTRNNHGTFPPPLGNEPQPPWSLRPTRIIRPRRRRSIMSAPCSRPVTTTATTTTTTVTAAAIHVPVETRPNDCQHGLLQQRHHDISWQNKSGEERPTITTTSLTRAPQPPELALSKEDPHGGGGGGGGEYSRFILAHSLAAAMARVGIE